MQKELRPFITGTPLQIKQESKTKYYILLEIDMINILLLKSAKFV